MAQILKSKGGGVAEVVTIRSSLILTTSYVVATTFETETTDQLQILAAFTAGSSAGCRLKIEFSPDETNWVQEPFSVWNGTDLEYEPLYRVLKIACDGIPIAIAVPTAMQYCRISAMAITSATGTLLELKIVRANL